MALEVTHEMARALVRNDLDELAPAFRAAVEAAIAECEEAGTPVRVYEALRTHELAAMYHVLKVSKAPNGYKTWHFYGLACDLVHPAHGWKWWESTSPDATRWRDTVCRVFRSHDMDWGGDWTTFRDFPHWQWGRCKPSPSVTSIRLYNDAGGGLAGRQAVWAAVGAE